MLLVKTYIGPSKIAGIGLFANEFIPIGTIIWRFQRGFDMRFDKNYPDTLPEPARSYFLSYAYQNKKTQNFVLCSNNSRFFNHCETPNTHCIEDSEDEETMDVASRDIEPGEELTVDYREFDMNPYYGFE